MATENTKPVNTERKVPTEEEFLADCGGVEGYEAWRARKVKSMSKPNDSQCAGDSSL